jgi:hypothetical protein
MAGEVLSAIGGAVRFLDDGPQYLTRAIVRMWSATSTEPRAIKLAMCALAVATDAIRASREALMMYELGSTFTLVRRSEEMQTLAIAIGFSPAVAEDWLSGRELSQSKLRKVAEEANPELAAAMRQNYKNLSNEAHGQVQSLSCYSDSDGAFVWPVASGHVDPARTRTACLLVLATLLGGMGVIRWLGQGWDFIPRAEAELTDIYYGGLRDFVLSHNESHGNWSLIDLPQMEEWLGLPPKE